MIKNLSKRHDIKQSIGKAYLLLKETREENKQFMSSSEIDTLWNVEQEVLKLLKTIQFNNEILGGKKNDKKTN